MNCNTIEKFIALPNDVKNKHLGLLGMFPYSGSNIFACHCGEKVELVQMTAVYKQKDEKGHYFNISIVGVDDENKFLISVYDIGKRKRMISWLHTYCTIMTYNKIPDLFNDFIVYFKLYDTPLFNIDGKQGVNTYIDWKNSVDIYSNGFRTCYDYFQDISVGDMVQFKGELHIVRHIDNEFPYNLIEIEKFGAESDLIQYIRDGDIEKQWKQAETIPSFDFMFFENKDLGNDINKEMI